MAFDSEPQNERAARNFELIADSLNGVSDRNFDLGSWSRGWPQFGLGTACALGWAAHKHGPELGLKLKRCGFLWLGQRITTIDPAACTCAALGVSYMDFIRFFGASGSAYDRDYPSVAHVQQALRAHAQTLRCPVRVR